MPTTTEAISETFLLIAERCAAIYGAPLPKGVLVLGGVTGWRVSLNTTVSRAERIEPFTAYVEWNEWPAGVIDPGGGVIAAGSAANLDTFLQWLKTAEKPE